MGGGGVGEGEGEENGDDQYIHAGAGVDVPGETDRNETSHCVMYSVILMFHNSKVWPQKEKAVSNFFGRAAKK